MGDLGDLFDMFSQDGDNDKKQRNAQDPESDNNAGTTNTRTQLINKLKQNKTLLCTVIGVGILVLGTAGFFLIRYIGDHGTKGILDIVMPFIK
jgi:hypothetical protein